MYLSLKVPEDSPRAPNKLVNVEVIAELMSWGDQSLKVAGDRARWQDWSQTLFLVTFCNFGNTGSH